MTSLDEVFDALADALELERELGVRTVEIDRTLLTVGGESSAAGVVQARFAGAASRRTLVGAAASPPPAEDLKPETRDAKAPLPIVFLHDRALSPAGVTMMAKAIAAMKLTPETAPILFTGARPAARVTVVLGSKALRRWFPGQAGSPGQWISPDGTPNVLVTYSPEHILRFGNDTAAVKNLKVALWTSLKAAMQRLS